MELHRPYNPLGPGSGACAIMLFSRDMCLELQEVKLTHHAESLLLTGAHVLFGGRKGWIYKVMGVGAVGKGMIIFANGKCKVLMPLVNAPVLCRPHFLSSAAISPCIPLPTLLLAMLHFS